MQSSSEIGVQLFPVSMSLLPTCPLSLSSQDADIFPVIFYLLRCRIGRAASAGNHRHVTPAGAVASTVVKQKLAEVILKKQQAAALERTSNPNPPAMPYR